MITELCLCRGAGIGYAFNFDDVMNLDSFWALHFYEEKMEAIQNYNRNNK